MFANEQISSCFLIECFLFFLLLLLPLLGSLSLSALTATFTFSHTHEDFSRSQYRYRYCDTTLGIGLKRKNVALSQNGQINNHRFVYKTGFLKSLRQFCIVRTL